MSADIQGVIEAVVREQLGDARILDVEVREGTDCEGEDVYRIRVVYDETAGRLDAHKTVGLIRHARSRLGQIGALHFPIFSFVSQGDVKRLGAAAA